MNIVQLVDRFPLYSPNLSSPISNSVFTTTIMSMSLMNNHLNYRPESVI